MNGICPLSVSNTYNQTAFNSDMAASTKMQKKSLDSSPDEIRTFERGKIELANFGDITIGRAVLEPGWSWEKSVKPIVKTNSCQQSHALYTVSGNGNNYGYFSDDVDNFKEPLLFVNFF
jgi:hypothetical protein